MMDGVCPDRDEARRRGGNQHVARSTRVLPDHDSTARRLEQVPYRSSQVIGKGRRQVHVGNAADAVGPEEATHQAEGAGVAGGTIVTVTEIGEIVTWVTPAGRVSFGCTR